MTKIITKFYIFFNFFSLFWGGPWPTRVPPSLRHWFLMLRAVNLNLFFLETLLTLPEVWSFLHIPF
jgi:hypothetical protein